MLKSHTLSLEMIESDTVRTGNSKIPYPEAWACKNSILYPKVSEMQKSHTLMPGNAKITQPEG